jgi:hypothetical protein
MKFRKIGLLIGLVLCASCSEVNDENKYSQFYSEHGIKFGGAFFYLNGVIENVRFSYGIDTSEMFFDVLQCGGVNVHAQYSPFSFLGKIAPQLREQVLPNLYRGVVLGEFFIVRNKASSGEGKAVNKTWIKITSAENECADQWLISNVVVAK